MTKLLFWCPDNSGKHIVLCYDDGSYLVVRLEDWNRAFGTIVSADREVVEKDYAVDPASCRPAEK